MLKNARDILCASILKSRCEELDLEPKVQYNTSLLLTPYTISVDKLDGCTTGVSAHDRLETIRLLANPKAEPNDFGRLGYIFPLYARNNGILERVGHTEATIDHCCLSGLYTVGALMEIINECGTMAR